MNMHKLGVHAFAIATAALLAVPALRAYAGTLKSFQAECEIASDGTTTCKGGQLGNATLTVTNFGFTPLGVVSTNYQSNCYIEVEDFVLTASDGSTVTFNTSGTQCSGNSNVTRNNAYVITSGTGRFVGVTGSGNFAVSGSLPSGTPGSAHIDGNIE